LNDLNRSMSMGENTTRIDIKRLPESLSHGEINSGSEIVCTSYIRWRSDFPQWRSILIWNPGQSLPKL
jgi:hypothetical protein